MPWRRSCGATQPTAVPADGCLSLGALIADANGLHNALDADEQAVLIGCDWGAEAAYGAAAFALDRWRRLVTLAIPPLSMDAKLFTDFDQLRRFFYMYLFTQPIAEELVAADEMAFLDRLSEKWSPGYDAAEDLALVKDCLRERANLSAAIGYYRAALGAPAESCSSFEAEQRALAEAPPQPTLYLHGARDRLHRRRAHPGRRGPALVRLSPLDRQGHRAFSPPGEARRGQCRDPGLGLTRAPVGSATFIFAP